MKMADEYMERGGTGGSGLTGTTIRVTPETLTQKAGELHTNAAEIRLLAANMTQKALELTGRIWTGEARSAYMTRIRTLQDNIDEYTPLVQKHAANLRAMADRYKASETEAGELSGALPGNIF